MFKVGDKVIFYRNVSDSKNRDHLLGNQYTIIDINGTPGSFDSKYRVMFKESDARGWIFRDNEICGITKLEKVLL